MGEVDCLEVDGCELFFNSDDHLPPHFHAEYDRGEVRVFYLRDRPELELRWGQEAKQKIRRALVEGARTHRLELHEEWGRKVGVRTPGPER
ncbi:MAG TPA: DUF4160 domain-containing protein [Polyangia bacterium]